MARKRFALEIAGAFEAVDDQLAHGLYVTKRAAAYLKKYVHALQTFATDIDKATRNESTKRKDLTKDMMIGFQTVTVSLQQLVGTVGTHAAKHAQKLSREVVDPLHDLHVKGEKQRSAITKSYSTAKNKLEALRKKVAKLEHDGQNLWQELLSTKKRREKEEALSKAQQMHDKKLKTLLKQASKCFAGHERAVKDLVHYQEEFVDSIVPQLLNECETLETNRMQALHDKFARLAVLLTEYETPSDQTANFATNVTKLDVQDSLRRFCEEIKRTGKGKGVDRDPKCSLLPVNSRALSTNQWWDDHVAGKTNQRGAVMAPTSGHAKTRPATPPSGGAKPAAAKSSVSKPAPPSSPPPASGAGETQKRGGKKIVNSSKGRRALPEIPSGFTALPNAWQGSRPPSRQKATRAEKKAKGPSLGRHQNRLSVMPTRASVALRLSMASQAPSVVPAAVAETKAVTKAATTEDSSPVVVEEPLVYVRAVYSYKSDVDRDLEFEVGDVIELHSEVPDWDSLDPQNPIWLTGERLHVKGPKQIGTFPSNYVKPITNEQE